MTTYDTPTDFAWIITEDHLYAKNPSFYDSINVSDEKGTTGPYQAPDDLTDYLRRRYIDLTGPNRPESGKKVNRYIFGMWDDDGEKYYSGILVTYADKPSDEALYAPLADFGGPNAGAVVIKYAFHPEWTMEY